MKDTKGARFLEALGEIDEKYIEEARYNTMKKKFNFKPIIAVAACAAFALAAIPVANHFAKTPAVQQTQAEKIGVNGKFTVYESGVHAGPKIGTHEVELRLNSHRKPYIDESKKGTIGKVFLNGQEWTAEYEDSRAATDYVAAAHSYTGVSNGKKVTFILNSVTGKCESFMFHTTENTSEEKLTRDELYKIAYANFLSGGYTDDPENYTFCGEGNNGTAGRWFRFYRVLGDIRTCEYVTIGLRNNGELYWYMGNRIGEMKDVDVSGIDMEKFYAAVEVKLKKIYGDAYIGFEREGAEFTKLFDGSYVFDYRPDVDVKDDTGTVVKDLCLMIITMD
jgi:hypothetical protein